MTDITSMSDDDLMAIANGKSAAPSLQSMSDEDLFKIANGTPTKRTPIGRVPRPGIDVPYTGNTAPTSTWSDVGSVVGRMPRGIAEGVASNLDTMATLTNRAVHDVPRPAPARTLSSLVTGPPTEPSWSPEQQAARERDLSPISTPLEAALPEKTPPASDFQSMADAGSRMFGESLIPMVGELGLAKSGARLAVGAAPTLLNRAKAFANRVLDTTAAKPARMMAGEAAANVESGAGGEFARERAEEAGGGPVAQGAAQLAGNIIAPPAANLLPAALVARAAPFAARQVVKGANAGMEMLGGAIPEDSRPAWLDTMAKAGMSRAQSKVEPTVQKELYAALSTPESQANMAEAQRLQSEIPGFNPGLARASGDQSLLNAQEAMDRNASGSTLRGRINQAKGSYGALENKFENTVPAAGENPAKTVSDAANLALVRQRVGLAAEENAQEQNIAGRSNIQPTQGPAEAGATLRGVRADERANATARVQELRGNIEAPNTPVQMGPPQWNAERGAFDRPPTQTVNQILDRRAQINQELRQYQSANMRTQADVARMNALSQERDRLDSVINDINQPGMQEYRDYYRDEFVPRFEQGASYKTGKYSNRGDQHMATQEEDIGKLFLGPNNTTEARQFNRLYGNNPQARQAAIDYKLDEMRHEVINPATGQINEGAVPRYLQKNERLLRELPWLREPLEAANPDQFYAQLGQLEQRRQALANTSLGKAMSGKGVPMAAALNDHVLMKQLSDAVGAAPEAQAALRRAAFDQMKTDAPSAIDDPDKFLSWLDGHARPLSQVFTPEHLNSLRTVAQAAQIQNRLPMAQGKMELPKSIAGIIGEKTGVTVPSAVGSVLAVARGRTSPFTEAPMQAVKMWNSRKAQATQAAWQAALDDPDMAKTLATVVRSKGASPMQIKKMYTYLLTSGALAAGGGDNGRDQ